MTYPFRALRKLGTFAAMLAASALFAGCTAPSHQDGAADASAASYHAQIRRTQDGIPHIKADDWGSLGYGFGYVQAQDDLCTLADSFVTWRGVANVRRTSAPMPGRLRRLRLAGRAISMRIFSLGSLTMMPRSSATVPPNLQISARC